MSGVKRQLSLLSLGFGQESGSSAPLEKRPAVNFECVEASEATQCQSQSDPAGSLTSKATESQSTGESQASLQSLCHQLVALKIFPLHMTLVKFTI